MQSSVDTLLRTAPVLLIAGSLLSGCATPPPDLRIASHVPPQDGQPSAKLLLRAAAPAGDRPMVVVLDDNEKCQGPKVLVRAAVPPETAAPAHLTPDRLTTLDFWLVRSNRTVCAVRWSFTPRADRTYLVQGFAMGTGCPAVLLDATQADRPRPPADLVSRSVAGNACVPLALAKAPAESALRGGQVNGEAVLRPSATTADLEGLIPK